MRRAAVAVLRAAAAVIGAALYRRTARGSPADPAEQQRWVLRNRSVPPARRRGRRHTGSTAYGPHRRRRHGGYGGAGAGI
ncbi:hypothetical protein Ade02nite_52140 [Paractinoplanes deccanensis]|uniref:Secreted protein n=1 Tax=Paractinoplanes deccanensis TaxID=113561 RepID=A0ABQ3Y995_9ACTN|nr:hypothetical protein Ade02nite_52140 [Actinoplanes deccanensis]